MKYGYDCFVCRDPIRASEMYANEQRGVRHSRCKPPPSLMPSLMLAGRLRANKDAMARATLNVLVDDAEVDSVLTRTPTQIAEWMVANNDRQISMRHFWELANRADATAYSV